MIYLIFLVLTSFTLYSDGYQFPMMQFSICSEILISFNPYSERYQFPMMQCILFFISWIPTHLLWYCWMTTVGSAWYSCLDKGHALSLSTVGEPRWLRKSKCSAKHTFY